MLIYKKTSHEGAKYTKNTEDDELLPNYALPTIFIFIILLMNKKDTISILITNSPLWPL